MPAEQRRVDGDVVADGQGLDAGADGDDLARELVAGHDRVGGGRKRAVGNVDVGAAHAAGADADDDLLGPWLGVGSLRDTSSPGCSQIAARMALLSTSCQLACIE